MDSSAPTHLPFCTATTRSVSIASESLLPLQKHCHSRDLLNMGVVFRPIDHHEASPELVPSNVMQCWGHKPQSTTTTTCVASINYCNMKVCSNSFTLSFVSILYDFGVNRLALTMCPFLSLQDCIDKSSGMCWLSEPSKCRQLHVSVMTSTKDQEHSLKRWASVVITPHRGIKRQRVSITRSYQVVNRENEQSDRASVGSIKSLQYALPGLSSHDTLHVLHAMRVIPSELRHLNGSASRSHLRRRCKVRQVFGWRHLLCQENDDRRVVWKSAKALDSMKMRPLARQIWKASTEAIGGLDDRETGEVLYTVNHRARVVHSTKRQYGSRRRARDQVWIECYLDDGLQVCVARKELRQFDEYRVPETSATECQGFLVRPMYTRAINAQLVGCSLQCLRAVDARDCGVRSASALKQQMLDDLPQLTLQCEEDYIYDLVQTPQLLLDSVFAT